MQRPSTEDTRGVGLPQHLGQTTWAWPLDARALGWSSGLWGLLGHHTPQKGILGEASSPLKEGAF